MVTGAISTCIAGAAMISETCATAWPSSNSPVCALTTGTSIGASESLTSSAINSVSSTISGSGMPSARGSATSAARAASLRHRMVTFCHSGGTAANLGCSMFWFKPIASIFVAVRLAFAWVPSSRKVATPAAPAPPPVALAFLFLSRSIDRLFFRADILAVIFLTCGWWWISPWPASAVAPPSAPSPSSAACSYPPGTIELSAMPRRSRMSEASSCPH
mmetsp:Transcript_77541/g.222951  ORF Transcript_77541/g.222951 Transcript_77541/m.222951 type:complete len:218 (+) Transcript_77541:102-755(+)